MKRRGLGVITAVTMAAGLVGCTGGAASQASLSGETKQEEAAVQVKQSVTAEEYNKGLTDEEITLTVWHICIDQQRHQAVTNAINRFMEKYPNIKVVDIANENDPYKTKLVTAMAAGEEPDIFMSWGGGWLESFIDEGKVLDIDPWIDKVSEEYYASSLSLFEIDDKKYALPFACGPAPVYYNKQIYEDLGLEIPETLEEFEYNCDKIKEAGITPIALGNSSQWPGSLTYTYLAMRKGGIQPFLDAYNRENEGSFEDASFVWAGEKLQEWVKKGYYPEGANGTNYDTGGSRMLFYNGMAAHIVQTNGMFSYCKSEAPEFYENNLGTFNFPLVEGGAGTAEQILGGGNGFSIASSSEHPREAFELLHFMTDQNFGQDSVNLAGVITGVKGVEMPDELSKEADKTLQNAEYIQNYYDQFLPTDLAALHKQVVYDLIGLTITPEEAAAQMEELAKQTLD